MTNKNTMYIFLLSVTAVLCFNKTSCMQKTIINYPNSTWSVLINNNKISLINNKKKKILKQYITCKKLYLEDPELIQISSDNRYIAFKALKQNVFNEIMNRPKAISINKYISIINNHNLSIIYGQLVVIDLKNKTEFTPYKNKNLHLQHFVLSSNAKYVAAIIIQFFNSKVKILDIKKRKNITKKIFGKNKDCKIYDAKFNPESTKVYVYSDHFTLKGYLS